MRREFIDEKCRCEREQNLLMRSAGVREKRIY
jgi:hypothetical protein